ncbi:MAG: YdiU family protein [Gammaproteobacteria bacterium]
MSLSISFVNVYATLPESCFERVQPTPVKKPRMIRFNFKLADELGICYDGATAEELAALFSGNQLFEDADPLAMAYCGHQFGHLNPQLGDGRAILLGDLIDQTGNRRDVQLKGCGRTPFSRNGDGRSPLGAALREYIMCEAMHALGVPTTRGLAVVNSGEYVMRQQREPGAVFTRVAASHIRVGTFQHFALRDDKVALHALVEHVLARHYPEIDPAAEDRCVQLFQLICRRQAELIARWMLLGFIHGVMNTDNMTVSGETIDYGPCAFMDAYRASTVFSAIDESGRYAYCNQPAVGQWNLARLAEALLTCFPGDEKTAAQYAADALNDYTVQYQQAWERGMAAKLGFSDVRDGDEVRSEKLLHLLEQGRLDYTLFFRYLSDLVGEAACDRDRFLARFNHTAPTVLQALHVWLDDWQQQLASRERDLHVARERMQAVNPAIIPRNHRVAAAISAAEAGDYSVFVSLLNALAEPYKAHTQYEAYQQAPTPREQVLRTFCGT